MSRIAVVHDWLTGWRGGEVVLAEILDALPQADLFALIAVPGALPPVIEQRLKGTSFLSRLPFVARTYRHLVPLYARAAADLDLAGYDLIVSSSHAAAKGVTKPTGSRHLCYCHSPARWAWDLFDDYFPARRWSPMWWFIRWQMARFRAWDRASAAAVDAFAANSRHVAERIARIYGRSDATVIHPPVDTEFFTPAATPAAAQPYVLMVAALVPYKRLELALDAFRDRSERLVIVGTGPEERRLRAQAPANVEFRGRVEPEQLRELYRGTACYLLPGEEDFGIATVEALACGRPIAAFGRGGAAEVVEDGLTGVFFSEPTAAALSSAIDRVRALPFNSAVARSAALRFARPRFRTQLLAWIDAVR